MDITGLFLHFIGIQVASLIGGIGIIGIYTVLGGYVKLIKCST